VIEYKGLARARRELENILVIIEELKEIGFSKEEIRELINESKESTSKDANLTKDKQS
jgi:DNA-binding transcriptional MerR regulator